MGRKRNEVTSNGASEINKVDAIRDHAKLHPEAKPSDIAAALAKQKMK